MTSRESNPLVDQVARELTGRLAKTGDSAEVGRSILNRLISASTDGPSGSLPLFFTGRIWDPSGKYVYSSFTPVAWNMGYNGRIPRRRPSLLDHRPRLIQKGPASDELNRAAIVFDTQKLEDVLIFHRELRERNFFTITDTELGDAIVEIQNKGLLSAQLTQEVWRFGSRLYAESVGSGEAYIWIGEFLAYDFPTWSDLSRDEKHRYLSDFPGTHFRRPPMIFTDELPILFRNRAKLLDASTLASTDTRRCFTFPSSSIEGAME